MKVFAISDLHLCASGKKPMDVFGPEWAGHPDKIAGNWRACVGPDDLVLLAGDLSWAMTLDEARPDFGFIEALPGTKYFIRGNHDYWYAGPSKVRAALGPTTHTLRFDAVSVGGVAICGVRGWVAPGRPDFDPAEDERHWRREIARLELSLRALGGLEWDVAVAMFHLPPRDADGGTRLTELISAAGVRHCVYGHLHGEAAAEAFEGEADGVCYRCVSADHIGFAPVLLFEHP